MSCSEDAVAINDDGRGQEPPPFLASQSDLLVRTLRAFAQRTRILGLGKPLSKVNVGPYGRHLCYQVDCIPFASQSSFSMPSQGPLLV